MLKKTILFLLFSNAIFISCTKEKSQRNINVKYPKTTKTPVIDTLFGDTVTDNYRWLEDDRSSKTEAWVKAENKVTFTYLNEIPYRKELKSRLSKLWNYEKTGTPFKEGDYTYFYKNNGLQDRKSVV